MKFGLVVNNGEFILDEKVTHIRRLTDVHRTEAKKIDEFRSLDDLDSLVGKLIEVWFVGGYYARFYARGAFFNVISRAHILSVTTTHGGKMKHKRKSDITIGEYITSLDQEEIKRGEKDAITIEVDIDPTALIETTKFNVISSEGKDVSLNDYQTQNGLIKKVDVLGVSYDIHLKVPFESDDYLDGCDGYCDYHAKKIVIGDCSKKNGYEWADLQAFENKVLRHELVHAFLYESGMNDLARDEKIVDWIAIQFPKIDKVFKEVF